MKKAFALILATVLCLSLMTGCCLSHEWVEANCTNPKTCAKCEKTSGEALGHSWTEANCVDPKTCSSCGETEGTALGHDWTDADCVTPKTCNRCNDTEGEALGHSYSGWVVTSNDTMTNSCTACEDVQNQPIDRELIGRQQLVGKWELVSVTMNDQWYDLNLGWTLEFYEDGTFDFTLSSDTESGVIEYEQFYVGSSMVLYVFDGKTAESTYSFNYDPDDDVVYILGSKFFKFERVAE
ncbi:MAG: hypothetical protein J6V25_12815 [Oscillospiraceae bacterium]|nr:hypothetical protein [Oscillospiraceae bacterium]